MQVMDHFIDLWKEIIFSQEAAQKTEKRKKKTFDSVFEDISIHKASHMLQQQML